jgi:hypothetical protein
MKQRLFVVWNEFLFARISPIPLCLFRIIFGSLVFADLLALFPSRFTWWSAHGILSRAGAIQFLGTNHLNVLNWFPETDSWLTLLYLVFIVASIALTLGIFSRVSSFIVYLGLTSLAHRNPLILNSGDTFLRVCSFWLIFTPSGARFSISSFRFAPPEPVTIEAWGLRILQIQFMIVYAMTFLSKLQGSEWLDGTAVGTALSLHEFARFPVPNFVFLPWMNHLLTWGSLLIEASLGFLIWLKPLRLWIIFAALALHLGIDYAMNIPLFEWIMIGSLSLFVSPELFRRPAKSTLQNR